MLWGLRPQPEGWGITATPPLSFWAPTTTVRVTTSRREGILGGVSFRTRELPALGR